MSLFEHFRSVEWGRETEWTGMGHRRDPVDHGLLTPSSRTLIHNESRHSHSHPRGLNPCVFRRILWRSKPSKPGFSFRNWVGKIDILSFRVSPVVGDELYCNSPIFPEVLLETTLIIRRFLRRVPSPNVHLSSRLCFCLNI